jgi:5-carboxymethyl-2-hydroxymuconic-semialdehyde dehydrogenase
MTDPPAAAGLATNLDQASWHLERFRSASAPRFIGGRAVDPGESSRFPNATPVDNSVLCEIARGTAAGAHTAVASAKAAFPASRDRSGESRKRILHRVADVIEARRDEIANIESMGAGQPIRQMGKAAVRGEENFRFLASTAFAAMGRSYRVVDAPGAVGIGRALAGAGHGRESDGSG